MTMFCQVVLSIRHFLLPGAIHLRVFRSAFYYAANAGIEQTEPDSIGAKSFPGLLSSGSALTTYKDVFIPAKLPNFSFFRFIN